MRMGGSDVYLKTGERRQSSKSAKIEVARPAAREGEKGNGTEQQGREREWVEGAVAPLVLTPTASLHYSGLPNKKKGHHLRNVIISI